MSNTFLSSESLDFNTLRSKLTDYLKSQSRFQDYDFEGSNMAVLLDLLSYNTYHNMYYLNMVGNEMFLDTALLRESVNSRSKMLNYIPKSRSASTAVVTLTVIPNDNPDNIFIPKHFPLFSQNTSGSLKFTTNETLTIKNNGGVYSISNVTIYEGNIVTEYFEIINSSTSFVTINSANVDVSSISVNVQTSNTVTTNTDFTQAFNLYGVDSNSSIYFIEPFGENQYNVVFGNGVLGKKLNFGNIVKITYRDTKGIDGDGATSFTAGATVGNNFTVYVSTQQKASGGSERETIDSIKYNAPRHYSTQDRAVTEQDINILIQRQFPQIESISVYGGEKAEPKRYGKVIIAAKPYGGTYISNSLKNQIKDYITERDVVSVDPIIIDPKYMFVYVNSKVYYSPSKIDFSVEELETLVRKSIKKYNTDELSKFNSDLRYSKLLKYIDDSDESVISNDTTVKLITRLSPNLNTPTSYKIPTNNELYHDNIAYKITDGNETTISSDIFSYIFNDTEYSSYIVDDGLGVLKIVSDTKDLGRIILNDNIGSVNYVSGVITINKLNVSNYSGSSFNLYAKLKGKDIIIRKEYILQIDDRDVVVTIERAAN